MKKPRCSPEGLAFLPHKLMLLASAHHSEQPEPTSRSYLPYIGTSCGLSLWMGTSPARAAFAECKKSDDFPCRMSSPRVRRSAVGTLLPPVSSRKSQLRTLIATEYGISGLQYLSMLSLLRQKQTSAAHKPMSAKCQKQTWTAYSIFVGSLQQRRCDRDSQRSRSCC